MDFSPLWIFPVRYSLFVFFFLFLSLSLRTGRFIHHYTTSTSPEHIKVIYFHFTSTRFDFGVDGERPFAQVPFEKRNEHTNVSLAGWMKQAQLRRILLFVLRKNPNIQRGSLRHWSRAHKHKYTQTHGWRSRNSKTGFGAGSAPDPHLSKQQHNTEQLSTGFYLFTSLSLTVQPFNNALLTFSIDSCTKSDWTRIFHLNTISCLITLAVRTRMCRVTQPWLLQLVLMLHSIVVLCLSGWPKGGESHTHKHTRCQLALINRMCRLQLVFVFFF